MSQPTLVPSHDYTEAELNGMYAEMERQLPDLWRRCYPRIYEDYKSNDYYSPKDVSRQMMGVSLKLMQGFVGESEKYEGLWASSMAHYRTPLYWVSRDMVQAVMQTTPPMVLDWYNMELPFPAIAFQIPKGMITHETEGDISFVSFARNKANVPIPGITRGFGGTREWTSINGGLLIFARTMKGHHLTHWNMPYDAFPEADLTNLAYLVEQYDFNEHTSGWFNSPEMTKEDTRLGILCAHFIFGILLLMTRKPELVEQGKLLKKVKLGHDTTATKEFWSPSVIGRDYKLKRVVRHLGGTHASPRYHWVRGFWREQPHGPKMSLRKDMWIEPYERGLE